MLSSKEENSEVKKITLQKLLCLISHQKRDDSRLEETGQQTQAKNSKEDEEFLNKLNMLIHENMAGGEFLLNS